jgi:pentatricopeptide repeat protein
MLNTVTSSAVRNSDYSRLFSSNSAPQRQQQRRQQRTPRQYNNSHNAKARKGHHRSSNTRSPSKRVSASETQGWLNFKPDAEQILTLSREETRRPATGTPRTVLHIPEQYKQLVNGAPRHNIQEWDRAIRGAIRLGELDDAKVLLTDRVKLGVPFSNMSYRDLLWEVCSRSHSSVFASGSSDAQRISKQWVVDWLQELTALEEERQKQPVSGPELDAYTFSLALDFGVQCGDPVFVVDMYHAYMMFNQRTHNDRIIRLSAQVLSSMMHLLLRHERMMDAVALYQDVAMSQRSIAKQLGASASGTRARSSPESKDHGQHDEIQTLRTPLTDVTFPSLCVVGVARNPAAARIPVAMLPHQVVQVTQDAKLKQSTVLELPEQQELLTTLYNTFMLELAQRDELHATRKVYKEMMTNGPRIDATTAAIMCHMYARVGSFNDIAAIKNDAKQLGFGESLEIVHGELSALLTQSRSFKDIEQQWHARVHHWLDADQDSMLGRLLKDDADDDYLVQSTPGMSAPKPVDSVDQDGLSASSRQHAAESSDAVRTFLATNRRVANEHTINMFLYAAVARRDPKAIARWTNFIMGGDLERCSTSTIKLIVRGTLINPLLADRDVVHLPRYILARFRSLVSESNENQDVSAETEQSSTTVLTATQVYNIVLDELGRHGRTEQMLDCFQDMPLHNSDYDNSNTSHVPHVAGRVPPNSATFCALVRGIALAGQPKSAIDELCRTMEVEYQLPMDSSVLSTVVESLLRKGDVDGALSRVETAAKLPRRVFPSTRALRRLLFAFYASGRTSEGVELYDVMVQNGMRPTISATNVVIATLFRSGDVEQGLRLFDECVAASANYGARFGAPVADADTYFVVFAALLSSQDYNHMSRVFDTMNGETIRSLPAAIRSQLAIAFTQAGDTDRADAVKRAEYGSADSETESGGNSSVSIVLEHTHKVDDADMTMADENELLVDQQGGIASVAGVEIMRDLAAELQQHVDEDYRSRSIPGTIPQ